MYKYFFYNVWFSTSILCAIFLIHSSYDINCFYFYINYWSFSVLLSLSSLNFSFISSIFLWKNLRISDSCSIKILEVLFCIIPILSSIYLWSSLITCIRLLCPGSIDALHMYTIIFTSVNPGDTQLFYDIVFLSQQIFALLP
jgi:hypothetical protein